MSGFDRPGVTLDEPAKRRSPGSRLADLGDRLARTFSTSDQTLPNREVENGEVEFPLDGGRPVPWDDQALPRFPIAKKGYDCSAVDEHVADLERELVELDREVADLRAGTAASGEVATEIERIGEQASAILLAAHDGAQETTRAAQAQADRCIADAAANAIAITTKANRELGDLESEKTSVYRERALLLEDIRRVGAALSSLADDAPEHFVPEPVRASRPALAASKRADPPEVSGTDESRPADSSGPPENSR